MRMNKAILMALAMGGMLGGMGYDDRTTISRINDTPPTDSQRRMFTQPVTLSKRQKAKLKKKKN